MRVYKVLLLVLVLILGIVYFLLDKELYLYGKNNLNVYGILPLNIKPVFRYEFEGGFALEDNHGFYIVSKGKHQYVHSEIKLNIKEFTNYYFDKEKLIAQIVNEDNNTYYIEFLRNNTLQIKQDIIVNVWDSSSTLQLHDLDCVKIKDNVNKFKKLELSRNFILIFLIISSLVFVFKAKKNTEA